MARSKWISLRQAIADSLRAFWNVITFKDCSCCGGELLRGRTSSIDPNCYDNDMTWVEYQWLLRRDHESPRLKGAPPRLHYAYLYPKSIGNVDPESGSDEPALPFTPPVTPPS